MTEAESISGAHAHEAIIIDIHPDANSDVNISRSSLAMKLPKTTQMDTVLDNIVMHLQICAQ